MFSIGPDPCNSQPVKVELTDLHVLCGPRGGTDVDFDAVRAERLAQAIKRKKLAEADRRRQLDPVLLCCFDAPWLT